MRRNTLAVLACLILVGGCTSHDSAARDDRPSGEELARRELAAGRLELRAYGLVDPQEESFAQLLQDRLGVRFTRVAGCAVGGDEAKQIEAYNRVMRTEIERRFGAGSIERLREEAARGPAATRPAT